jgi:hypothetical protein
LFCFRKCKQITHAKFQFTVKHTRIIFQNIIFSRVRHLRHLRYLQMQKRTESEGRTAAE